mmetsp:Transcript_17377/g.27845  ORF Transcript_17377/g.27845 Transcript_17377/m.27845 type:complete len:216 (+) Transcript_17377:288-935(+)
MRCRRTVSASKAAAAAVDHVTMPSASDRSCTSPRANTRMSSSPSPSTSRPRGRMSMPRSRSASAAASAEGAAAVYVFTSHNRLPSFILHARRYLPWEDSVTNMRPATRSRSTVSPTSSTWRHTIWPVLKSSAATAPWSEATNARVLPLPPANAARVTPPRNCLCQSKEPTWSACTAPTPVGLTTHASTATRAARKEEHRIRALRVGRLRAPASLW